LIRNVRIPNGRSAGAEHGILRLPGGFNFELIEQSPDRAALFREDLQAIEQPERVSGVALIHNLGDQALSKMRRIDTE